jgi:hypothetical protein
MKAEQISAWGFLPLPQANPRNKTRTLLWTSSAVCSPTLTVPRGVPKIQRPRASWGPRRKGHSADLQGKRCGDDSSEPLWCCTRQLDPQGPKTITQKQENRPLPASLWGFWVVEGSPIFAAQRKERGGLIGVGSLGTHAVFGVLTHLHSSVGQG